jgi:uncharacterized protein YkwD
MILRFSITIIISVLVGVILGTSSSFIPVILSSRETQEVALVPIVKPILLSDNKEQVFEQKEEQSEEIVYFKEVTEEMRAAEIAATALEEVEIEVVEPTVSPEVATPLPSSTPELVASPNLDPEVIFNLINEKRVQAGLLPLEKDSKVCELASSRTPELEAEFTSGSLHRGFYARQMPYRAAENVIYMRSEQAAVNWWMNSGVHRSQLLGNYKYSCVACQGQSCTQIFANI